MRQQPILTVPVQKVMRYIPRDQNDQTVTWVLAIEGIKRSDRSEIAVFLARPDDPYDENELKEKLNGHAKVLLKIDKSGSSALFLDKSGACRHVSRNIRSMREVWVTCLAVSRSDILVSSMLQR